MNRKKLGQFLVIYYILILVIVSKDLKITYCKVELLHASNCIYTLDIAIFRNEAYLSSFFLCSSSSSYCYFVICLTFALGWFLMPVFILRYFSIFCSALWNYIDNMCLSHITCEILSAILSNLLRVGSLITSCFSCFTANVLNGFHLIAGAREQIRLVSLNAIPTGRLIPLANAVVESPPVIVVDVVRPVSRMLVIVLNRLIYFCQQFTTVNFIKQICLYFS